MKKMPDTNMMDIGIAIGDDAELVAAVQLVQCLQYLREKGYLITGNKKFFIGSTGHGVILVVFPCQCPQPGQPQCTQIMVQAGVAGSKVLPVGNQCLQTAGPGDDRMIGLQPLIKLLLCMVYYCLAVPQGIIQIKSNATYGHCQTQTGDSQ